MTESTTDPDVPKPGEPLTEIADILAGGYLRLLQYAESSHGQGGQAVENNARTRPPERLDSRGNKRDQWGTG